MQPNLATCNANSTDIMPMWSGVCVCQPLWTTKNNHFAFSGINYPKCKWEHANDASHCIIQWEQCNLQ